MKIACLSLALLASGTSAPEPQSARVAADRTVRSVDGTTASDEPAATETDNIAVTAQKPSATEATPAVDLTRERTLIDESEAARKTSDYATARAKAVEAVRSLVARPESEQDAEWLNLLNSAAVSAYYAQDMRTAKAAWQRVLDIRSRTLPDDHPDLQRARANLARTIHTLGDLAGARALFEKVLEVQSRTLPDEHPDLQWARGNLAATIKALGDLAGARALEEKVLEVRSRILPDEHPDLQAARGNLAVTIRDLGDLAGARALQEKVLEVYSRTLPDDHPDLQRARTGLAGTIYQLGDAAGARALFQKVLEVRSRTLPDDHPDLQGARGNLAVTLDALGDLAGARALQEKVLEVCSRTLPDEHPDLQAARLNLAVTAYQLGDLAGARTLQEKVLEVRSRTLQDEHPDLQAARNNLAATIDALGDLAGARALREKVLEVNSRTLPDEHPDLQAARLNLALTACRLGDLAGARALQEKVLEVYSRTLPDEHPNLQRARGSLASTIKRLGDFAGARALEEKVLEVRSRTLPDDHPELQAARGNLALTIRESGDFPAARALQEKVLEVQARTMRDDHPGLQLARQHLAATIARQFARASHTSGGEGENTGEREAGRQRCSDLIGALCRAQVHAAREAILAGPSREAEERCASLAKGLEVSLSFASGMGVFEPLRMLESESFVLAETTRGAAIVSAELTRNAASAPQYTELRDALRDASDELARLAQKGTTSEEFDRARTKRESVERELVALARELLGGEQSGVELDVESLAARLEEHEAAVGFRRFTKWRLEVGGELDSTGQPAVRETSVDSLCAFVVRSSKRPGAARAAPSTLALVDLGPIAPVEAAVRGWRDGLGVGSSSRGVAASARAELTPAVRAQGTALCEKIFDPLAPALAGVRRIVVVLDDVLHLVPVDALPVDENTFVGDRWQIETRTTLTELFRNPDPSKESGQLVAFGDVEYGAEKTSDEAGATIQLASTHVAPREAAAAGILRGSAWSEGFAALPGTGVEVRGIARCFADQFRTAATPELCEHTGATRERLLTVAPQARWLHLATHGWFAPESIQSWSDPEPLDKLSGLGMRVSGEEQVNGMSPMLLCGLALAGANLPQTATGRMPGLVTADELSTLDLTNCELVVLSACDTNVGVRRAGQGVASLQKALQMAGARSVITSLWKVPDEATKELMLDFYRRMWVERKPKWQALWEAKKKLREAKDDRGQPKYSMRDWAAWVLTGDPN